MFEAGNVVRLKSTGSDEFARPLMTVTEVLASGRVRCAWFDVEDKLHRDCFEPATLDFVRK